MLVELHSIQELSYVVINRRGLVVLDTRDHSVAALCEERLAQEERREPEQRVVKLPN
jgi:hypothetical protein